jgi:hypothetical protein
VIVAAFVVIGVIAVLCAAVLVLALCAMAARNEDEIDWEGRFR